MSARDNIQKFLKDVDSEDVRQALEATEDGIQKFQQFKGKINDDQQEAENLEEETLNLVQNSWGLAKQIGQEIGEAEAEGNEEELEDAEEGEEEAIQETGRAIEYLHRTEQDEVEEIKLEERQEELVKQVEIEAEKLLTHARNNLSEEYGHLLDSTDENKNAQLNAGDVQRINQILEEFKGSIQVINQATWMIQQLTQEIIETEKEENQLEQLSQKVSQEFGFMEDEVKELENDYQKLHDPQHEKMAGKEANELSKEEQQFQQEINEEGKIDAELGNDVEGLQEIVDKEENGLLTLINNSIEDLRQLYKILDSDQMFELWRFREGKKPPLKEIENTINVLQSGLKKDEKAIQNSNTSGVMKMMPDGPNLAGHAKKHSRKIIYIVGATIAGLILFGFAAGNGIF